MFPETASSPTEPSLQILLQPLKKWKRSIGKGSRDLQHPCKRFTKAMSADTTNLLLYQTDMYFLTILEARSSRRRYLFLLRPCLFLLTLGCRLCRQTSFQGIYVSFLLCMCLGSSFPYLKWSPVTHHQVPLYSLIFISLMFVSLKTVIT